jgi:hypothetical protein
MNFSQAETLVTHSLLNPWKRRNSWRNNMRDYQLYMRLRYIKRLRAQRPAKLATLCYLLTLLSGCLSTVAQPLLVHPDPPAPELTQLCDEGPSPPEGDATVSEVTSIVRGREKAFAECRIVHEKLIDWTKVVSKHN